MSRSREKHSCAAKETFHAAVTLLLAGKQVSIDTARVDVKAYMGSYCPKGEWQGRLDFRRYKAFIVVYEHIVRPGTLLIVERIGDEHYRYGIWHPVGAVCSIAEMEVPFAEWASGVGRSLPSLTTHDVEDLTQDVFVKTAEGLSQGKYIVYSPRPFLTTMARNLQINRWRSGTKMTALSPAQAAAIPSNETVSQGLEVADEMAAAVSTDDLHVETLHSLRGEMVQLDPAGTILLLGKFLENSAPQGLYDFYQTLIRNEGDPEQTAHDQGIAPGSFRTYLYRLRMILWQHRRNNDKAA